MYANEILEKYGIPQQRLSYLYKKGHIKRSKENTPNFDYEIDDALAAKLLDGSLDARFGRAGSKRVNGEFVHTGAPRPSGRPSSEFTTGVRSILSQAKDLQGSQKAWRASGGSKVLVVARTFHFDDVSSMESHKSFLDEALISISKALSLDVNLSTISNNLELSVVYNAK